ncbi:GltB/FmdC/FwdC-like GXGXG domain-containing protein [Archaeoglobus veneficus]|uniref:Glutamate synthase alpha subunit domain protein n=1 Tax=Archaeoglobus veneficus (strain DSM 11195 / SNP6) TaxID=693661 RepID=F2KRC1_ARCVS|nr:glutamate synthase [Archaeoglobus veneficus]AEA47855.1 glutamate synthase alpha subunit domain protein [Archaeoglobus veneficus SNP6]
MRIIDRLMERAELRIPDGQPVEISEECDIQKLVEVANEYLDMEIKLAFQLNPEKCFDFGRKMRRKYSVTLREVEEFVNSTVYDVLEKRAGEIRDLLCHQFYENYLGYFVSGLYHDIIRDKTLSLSPKLPRLLAHSRVGLRWGFGYRHPGGNLIISGYAGGYLGEKMENGKIIVTGYTGDKVGFGMRGGEILIKGNVGWRLGDSMKGGRIIVFGNAGQFVGIDMEGGVIKIKGDVTSFGPRKGGEIFVWEEEGWKRVE